MKHKLLVGFLATSALVMGVIGLFFAHEARLRDLQRQKLAQAFESNRSTFNELAESWERLPLKMNSCGQPEMAPGLVHFAVLERTAQGKIRVGQDPIFSKDGFEVSVGSIDEAAKFFGANREAFSNHLKLMDSAYVTEMFQHDAELHFVQDGDSSLSLMYVPSNCRQYSPFARIRQLAPEWFLVEEK